MKLLPVLLCVVCVSQVFGVGYNGRRRKPMRKSLGGIPPMVGHHQIAKNDYMGRQRHKSIIKNPMLPPKKAYLHRPIHHPKKPVLPFHPKPVLPILQKPVLPILPKKPLIGGGLMGLQGGGIGMGLPPHIRRLIGSTVDGLPKIGGQGKFLRHGGAGKGQKYANGLRNGWGADPNEAIHQSISSWQDPLGGLMFPVDYNGGELVLDPTQNHYVHKIAKSTGGVGPIGPVGPLGQTGPIGQVGHHIAKESHIVAKTVGGGGVQHNMMKEAAHVNRKVNSGLGIAGAAIGGGLMGHHGTPVLPILPQKPVLPILPKTPVLPILPQKPVLPILPNKPLIGGGLMGLQGGGMGMGLPPHIRRLIGSTVDGLPKIGGQGKFLRHGGAGKGQKYANGLRNGWGSDPNEAIHQSISSWQDPLGGLMFPVDYNGGELVLDPTQNHYVHKIAKSTGGVGPIGPVGPIGQIGHQVAKQSHNIAKSSIERNIMNEADHVVRKTVEGVMPIGPVPIGPIGSGPINLGPASIGPGVAQHGMIKQADHMARTSMGGPLGPGVAQHGMIKQADHMARTSMGGPLGPGVAQHGMIRQADHMARTSMGGPLGPGVAQHGMIKQADHMARTSMGGPLRPGVAQHGMIKQADHMARTSMGGPLGPGVAQHGMIKQADHMARTSMGGPLGPGVAQHGMIKQADHMARTSMGGPLGPGVAQHGMIKQADHMARKSMGGPLGPVAAQHGIIKETGHAIQKTTGVGLMGLQGGSFGNDPAWIKRLIGSTKDGRPRIGGQGKFRRHGGAGPGNKYANGLKNGWGTDPNELIHESVRAWQDPLGGMNFPLDYEGAELIRDPSTGHYIHQTAKSTGALGDPVIGHDIAKATQGAQGMINPLEHNVHRVAKSGILLSDGHDPLAVNLGTMLAKGAAHESSRTINMGSNGGVNRGDPLAAAAARGLAKEIVHVAGKTLGMAGGKGGLGMSPLNSPVLPNINPSGYGRRG